VPFHDVAADHGRVAAHQVVAQASVRLAAIQLDHANVVRDHGEAVLLHMRDPRLAAAAGGALVDHQRVRHRRRIRRGLLLRRFAGAVAAATAHQREQARHDERATAPSG
jgi:hypothetical protein